MKAYTIVPMIPTEGHNKMLIDNKKTPSLHTGSGKVADIQPSQHWFTMCFKGYLETNFRRVNYLKNINATRICAAIVPAALIVGLVSHFVMTGAKPDFTFLAPVVILLFINVVHIALTFTDRFWRHNELIMAVGNVIYSSILGYIAYQLPPHFFTSMFGFVLLSVLGGYAATGARFPVNLVTQICVSAVWFVTHILKGHYPSPNGQAFLLITYFLGVNIFGAFISRIIETYARRQFLLNELLVAEKENSNKILCNALPAAIVARLGTGEIVADFHPDVAVVFADLVGFTAYSASRPVGTVASMLNQLFSGLDAVVIETGLEKIKTIGDSYMAAAGVPEPCADPAHRAVSAAVKMFEQLAILNAMHGTAFDLRIGIHVGSVVAGVIGQTKYSYDIWGDAVNVASRMESTGIPGLIQVSDVVRARLGSEFEFSRPFTKNLKGKGTMVTHFLSLPHSRSLIPPKDLETFAS